jgi:hypothetical protein
VGFTLAVYTHPGSDGVNMPSCRKFRLNTASRNIYFEFFKISGFARTRVYYVILDQY